MKKYVAYYRVSTKQQGVSGLGLESQKNCIAGFAKDATVIAEYVEVESGKNNNRIELDKAIQLCKKENAILLIAKLDRLSRNVSFIALLMDQKVKFVCCDMPTANEFTIHIFAALAQQERELISSRTKAALAELKKKGIKLGTNNLNAEHQKKAVETIKANAKEANKQAIELIRLYREQGKSFQNIADKLNELGVKTRTGKTFFKDGIKKLYDANLIIKAK